MSQGNDFANYGSGNEEPAGSDGLWYVAVASDDIKTMTLDQLDEAFRSGVINSDTSVWTEGMEAWAPLRVVADLDASDGDASADAPAASDSGYGAPPRSDVVAAQHSQAGAQHLQSAPAHAQVAPQQASVGFQSPFGSVVESTAPAGSLSPFGVSTAPVALNVDDDMPAPPARKWHPARWGIGAVALCALGFVLYRSDVFASSSASEATAAAAAAPAAAPIALGTSTADRADEDEPAASAKAADEADEEGATKPAGSAKEDEATAAKGAAPSAALTKPASATTASGAAALKGSVADALRKKPAKEGRASKARKASKKARATKSKAKRSTAASRPASSSSNKAGSAFDPLNDSLP